MSRFRFDGRGRGPSSQPGSSRFPWHWFKPTLPQPRSAKSGHCPAQYEASAPSALSPKFDAGTPCEDHPSFKRRAPRKGRSLKKRRVSRLVEGLYPLHLPPTPPLAHHSTTAHAPAMSAPREATPPRKKRLRHPGEGWSGIGRHLPTRRARNCTVRVNKVQTDPSAAREPQKSSSCPISARLSMR